ncbi:MAG: DEAD/DEAH box helicase family protein [Telluria sp.]
MIKLRYYQHEAIEALYRYFNTYASGNPIIDTPTGSGKSMILAAFIRRFLEDCPRANVIVLTHVKELIEQDAQAILRYWPEAPISFWSAGIGIKEKAQITVAGIQSIHSHPTLFSPCDVVIIDECHLMSKNSDTMYRRFIAGLLIHNPNLKVIGLSATPYRLDSGLLTEGKGRIFTDIAYSANVGDLIAEGFLSSLVSKAGMTRADLTGLHTRGGEFLPAELADRMDKVELIRGAVDEMLAYGQRRKSWLVFCSGVQHAQHVADCLNLNGIPTATIHGETPKGERAKILADFKAGRIRALTNADVLTTGFDHPGVDMIALLRPTKSVGLYVQILGRGLRVTYANGFDLETAEGRLAAIMASGKQNCLVLDFAGNVSLHGPIDCIKIKPKAAPGEDSISVAPVKECPSCNSLVHASIMLCPECGHEWEASAKHDAVASDAALLASQIEPKEYRVTGMALARHKKMGKPDSLRVTYSCGDLKTFTEYVAIESPLSYPRKLAVNWFWKRGMVAPKEVGEALFMTIPTPETITVIPDGKYHKITNATFKHE